MQVIRTAEEMTHALASPDPELKQLLQAHWERLQEFEDYTLEELAQFIIAEAGDTLDDIMTACGWSPVGDGTFDQPVELIEQHSGWIEAVFILSDDGFGLVLLVEVADETDPELLAICNQHLQQPK
jgi:hypothetical protein